jgi:seryl-tRNA synthetase
MMRKIAEAAKFANNNSRQSNETKRNTNSTNLTSSNAQGSESSHGGLQSRKFELQCELQSLQKKEKELLEALGSTNNALQELGVPSFLIHDDQEELKNMDRLKASGLRMKHSKNALSFRGEDKVREQFNLIDLNEDGYLGYEDLRGLASLPFDCLLYACS